MTINQDDKRLELAPIALADKSVLRRLMELYLHDSSEFSGDDIDEHGLYGYKHIDHYWTESERRPFFIKVQGKIAGFVLVTLWPEANFISEFFIMRKYRRQGLGGKVAHRVFRMFTGTWNVAQEEGNKPAQAFWRKTIADFTGGDYTEEHNEKGPLQVFAVPDGQVD